MGKISLISLIKMWNFVFNYNLIFLVKNLKENEQKKRIKKENKN